MNEQMDRPQLSEPLETVLRGELARADGTVAGARPVLRHLLRHEAGDLFNEEIVSRVRSMIDALATTIATTLNPSSHQDLSGIEHGLARMLATRIVDNDALLGFLHANALEWQISAQMQARLALDPVVSPLLRELIAASDAQIQSLAMAFLAAQSRWTQAHRHMNLVPADLPRSLLDGVMDEFEAVAADLGLSPEMSAQARATFVSAHDEARGRLDIAVRLTGALPEYGRRALAIEHAGIALFLTALSGASEQPRIAMTFALHEMQVARLALSLRACGLSPHEVVRQFVTLHPDIELPDGFEQLGVDEAANILAGAPGAYA